MEKSNREKAKESVELFLKRGEKMSQTLQREFIEAFGGDFDSQISSMKVVHPQKKLAHNPTDYNSNET